jgi:hypothetical protein
MNESTTTKVINKLSSLKSYLKKVEIPDYYYIIQDFETSSEKECAKMDSKNLERYNHLLKKATKAQRSIGNTGLSMNLEVPPPPIPNNRDRYNLWRRRNAIQKVIPQSDAVYFLTKEGYELNKDYEAYQAIGLAEQIMKEKGIRKSNEDISKNFKNIYNENDHNLVRRFSVYGMNEFTKARKTAANRTIESMRQLENEEFERTRTQSLPNIVRQTELEEASASFVQASAPSQLEFTQQTQTTRSLTELYPKCEV